MTVKKKIVLLGDSTVGKTSLIRRYVFNQFEDSYIATIGRKFTMRQLRVDTPDKAHAFEEQSGRKDSLRLGLRFSRCRGH